MKTLAQQVPGSAVIIGLVTVLYLLHLCSSPWAWAFAKCFAGVVLIVLAFIAVALLFEGGDIFLKIAMAVFLLSWE